MEDHHRDDVDAALKATATAGVTKCLRCELITDDQMRCPQCPRRLTLKQSEERKRELKLSAIPVLEDCLSISIRALKFFGSDESAKMAMRQIAERLKGGNCEDSIAEIKRKLDLKDAPVSNAN